MRQLIYHGFLEPGQRVPQDDIAVTLGVSRMAVREAVVVLGREGWVQIENYRGAFVTAFSPETIEDQYNLMCLLFGFAIRLAMERSGDEFVEKVTALGSELAETTDRRKAAQHIANFWEIILDCARSSRLQFNVRSMSASSLIPGDYYETVPAAIGINRKTIAAVVRALRRRDTDRAVREVRKALRENCAEVMRLYRERGLFKVPDTADSTSSKQRLPEIGSFA
jgi:DNA-binding GntR family transcriptional regulator